MAGYGNYIKYCVALMWELYCQFIFIKNLKPKSTVEVYYYSHDESHASNLHYSTQMKIIVTLAILWVEKRWLR